MVTGAPDISPPVPVVCAIIEKDGLFLAAKRGEGSTNAGLWEFPGGKVRPGENEIDALHRELGEELRIEVKSLERRNPHIYTYPHITIELIPYRCSLHKGHPRPLEHAAIRWLTLGEAISLAWTPADLPVLREYGVSIANRLGSV